ncbi:MAG: glycosyl hydrolase [bacterium]
MRTKTIPLSVFLCGALALVTCGSAGATDELQQGFMQPPDAAKPHTWWHWMNGNITKEGITADLEAMQRVGLGGAQIFNAAEGIPHGSVDFNSKAWREMVQFAASEARRLGLELCIHNCAGWSSSGGPWNTPEHSMKIVVTCEQLVKGPARFDAVLPHPKVKRDFYRDIALLAFPTPVGERVSMTAHSPRIVVEDLENKVFFKRDGKIKPASGDAGAACDPVQTDQIIDLTAKMTPDGRLAWGVPDGEWTILRVGYTSNDRSNHPAPAEGTGLECDKLSSEAAQAHWDGMMGKLIEELGPLAGNIKDGLNNVLIDSYEVGPQNWTQKFREEFKKRRGYDLIHFLPVFTGRVVDSPEITDRFTWDLRRTIADLFAENYSGQFAKMAHRAGLLYSVEPYGNCPSDDLQYGSSADIPMSEFWPGNDTSAGNAKLAASVAHVYGRKFVGAESFTAPPNMGKWLKDPYSLKIQGDSVYCAGVNRIIYHRYAHQPWTKPDRYPGMTMGQWGTHFERTVTWWEQSRAWLKYQARCQYLLQEGTFVADVLFYCGEGAPNSMPDVWMPKGYDYDGCSADALMNRMSVRNGRIVLADGAGKAGAGMSYRLLVLPDDKTMSLPVLRKIKKWVDAGAIVVGPKPVKAPGLVGYPQCDADVKRLADEVWPKILSGKAPADVLKAAGVKPDFECTNTRAQLAYIHRVKEDADIYFVSNQKYAFDQAECLFRVSGKTPEFWYPETGKIETAPVYSEQDGRTSVLLRFEPAEAVFVVFRRKPAADHAVSVRYAPAVEQTKPSSDLTILKAEYGVLGNSPEAAGKVVDVTAKLVSLMKDGALEVQVDNGLAGRDPAYLTPKELRVEYRYKGKVKVTKLPENQILVLPDEGGAAFSTYELAVHPGGGLEVYTWKPGVFEVQTASGKVLKVAVHEVPKPQEITGAWELSFPPNWGAPEKLVLDKLISWTAHNDKGVNYFSGTATYRKTFDVQQVARNKQKAKTYLDLGDLKNIAEVTLNGKELGILWKPPFRVEVTDTLRTGKNDLVVKITNLWPNRLIGDEFLPADREWNGMQLKAWPAWVLEGKPSPTGRFTFTTWHHWTKEDDLLPSGLFGPVMLRTVDCSVVK